MPKHITSLTALRGIFVVFVVLFHCKAQWATDMATSGVVFFFMMSGFLLQRRYGAKPQRSAAERRRFWFMRAKRIYPLHWVALAMLLAMGIPYNLLQVRWYILPQVFLVQPFIPIRDVFLNYNHPSWFLGDLLVCYALFPLLASLLRKVLWRTAASAVAISYVVYIVALIPPYGEPVITYLHVCPLVRLYEFVVGMVLYEVFRAMRDRCDHAPSQSRATIIELAAVALFALFIALCRRYYLELYNYNDMTWWYVPIAALIFTFVWCAEQPGIISKVLHWAPLVWLGNLCFEIYIFQAVAAYIFNIFVCPFFGHFGFVEIYNYYAWGLWPILLVIAYLTHRYFTPFFDNRAAKKTQKTKKS